MFGTSQEIGWEYRLRNHLCCVNKRDAKPYTTQLSGYWTDRVKQSFVIFDIRAH